MSPFALVSYGVFHASKGVGSGVIRLTHPGAWANHYSFLFAGPSATDDELLDSPLFEARSKKGVTGIRPDGSVQFGTRLLRQAIAGGDQVEVYRWHRVEAAQEEAAFEKARLQCGKPYDAPGLGGFLPFPHLRDHVLKQQQRKYDAAWWCSEIGMAETMWRGLPALLNVQPYQVDPEWLRSSPLMTFRRGWPENIAHGV